MLKGKIKNKIDNKQQQAKTRKIMANEIINYQTSMFPLV
jgi:hypothetical protein